jgi:hypothetical protein
VPSQSLAINEVPSIIRNQAYKAKNKIFKPHETKRYLTLLVKIIQILSLEHLSPF